MDTANRQSNAWSILISAIFFGALAGLLTGLLDYVLNVAEGISFTTLIYALAIMLLGGLGAGCAVGALLVLGQFLGRLTSRFAMALFPLAFGAAFLAYLFNSGIFSGPAISQKPWANAASLIVIPSMSIVAFVAVLKLKTVADWTRRGKTRAWVACGVVFLAHGSCQYWLRPLRHSQ